jgi:hypothetical protein
MKTGHWLLLSSLLGLASCQTVSTKNQHTINTAFPDTAPQLILVRDFEAATAVLKRDAKDEDLTRQITQQISAGLLRGFKAASLNAKLLPPGQKAGDQGWVVTGRFRLVQWSNINDDSNDRAANDDRIECTAYVYDISKSRAQPFLTFDIATPRLTGNQNADSASNLKATCDALSQIVIQRVQDYVQQNF